MPQSLTPRGVELDFNFNILYQDGGRVRGGSAGAVGDSTFMVRREGGREQRHGVGTGREEGERGKWRGEHERGLGGKMMEREKLRR